MHCCIDGTDKIKLILELLKDFTSSSIFRSFSFSFSSSMAVAVSSLKGTGRFALLGAGARAGPSLGSAAGSTASPCRTAGWPGRWRACWTIVRWQTSCKRSAMEFMNRESFRAVLCWLPPPAERLAAILELLEFPILTWALLFGGDGSLPFGAVKVGAELAALVGIWRLELALER